MAIARVKTIRALERGLDVVRLLNAEGALSLDVLHRRTGLPRATLSRILLTLQQTGFAAQRIADDRWAATPLPAARGVRSRAAGRLARVASPILDELCRAIIWPSDLSVRVGSHMELVETSRAHSSLMLGRLRVGFPINMLLSAPGRAYLAYTGEKERGDILARLARRAGPGQDIAVNAPVVDHILRETRRRGYGVRDDGWGGHISASKADYDDGLSAIAVPVMHEGKVLGCVNIVWIRNLLTQADMARRHLPQLTGAAAAIAQAYGAAGDAPRTGSLRGGL